MSAPEPCLHCEGKCCRDTDYGGRIYHMAAESYEHWCDYCADGDKYIQPRTVLDERRDVLAWLRDVGTSASMSADEMVTINWIARAIYGMEHVGAATKGKP